LGSDNKTIPQMVIWEKGGEENIWSENEWNNKRMEKIT
jgi:hypothetical protein